MATRTSVPNLIVARSVINKMAVAAAQYIEDETGEAMIGLVSNAETPDGKSTVYVLDTISPDETAIREAYAFKQGDDRQDELIWWFHQNWEMQRNRRRKSYGSGQAQWDAPLRHVGDWHRQPGHMIAPSGGDLYTALEMLDDGDSDFEFLLAPIVTLEHPATTADSDDKVNYVTVPGSDIDTFTRIDFWYIDNKIRMFLPITPVIHEDDTLPKLVQAPWHLVHEDRYQTELAQLRADGLFTSVLFWDVNDELPLKICVMCARQGASSVIVLSTSWNYPETPPTAYLAPFLSMNEDEVMYDVFERMWKEARQVDDPPGWTWTKDKYLLDYIRTVEEAHNLRPKTATPDKKATGTIEQTAAEDES